MLHAEQLEVEQQSKADREQLLEVKTIKDGDDCSTNLSRRKVSVLCAAVAACKDPLVCTDWQAGHVLLGDKR